MSTDTKNTKENKKLKYIWFSYDGIGFPVAKKLIDEGNTVIVAQIQTALEMGNGKKEDPEKTKERLALYDGILHKHDAKKVLKSMEQIKNKNEWFVIFDFNHLWRYSELALKMGFTQGFFPRQKDYELEQDRDAAKRIVKKHYPDLKVAAVHEFKKIDEAIKFLESNTEEHTYVLKGYSDDASTVLPAEGKTFELSPDIELAKQELIGALEVEKKDYEKKGFILEQKVVNPLEITPEAVFYNGELVLTCVDIENKPIGSGSTGCMTGCAGNLIIKTTDKDRINKIAFPKFVYDMARAHKGLFVWDASILIDPKNGELYFGEFCANRWGWDSFFAELTMCDSVTDYFESIVEGLNPLKKTFGAGVRMFNLKKHADVPVIFKGKQDGVYVYDIVMKDEKLVSTGADWDLLSANGADNNPNTAIDNAYKALDGLSFNNGYFRPRFDFLSTEYANSIPNRLAAANHKFFNVKELQPDAVTSQVAAAHVAGEMEVKKTQSYFEQEMENLRSTHESETQAVQATHAADLKALRDEMNAIINS